MENTSWLPKCLAHLNQPYLKSTDDFVAIGEISSESHKNYRGTRELYTALVPLDRVEAVLNNPGGIGHEVQSGGPRPSVKKGDGFKSDFWVRGIDSAERFEPLVVSWEYHNKTVMMPDNGLLMCYGLCPRILKDPERIIWDNLSLPEYDVVCVKPLSHYNFPSNSGCSVKINRQYLEDYASLKNCAIVAVFYEERYCALDDELKERLNGLEAISITAPGRLIDIKCTNLPGDEAVLCQIWGCRLILIPESRPISDEHSLDLEWPDYPGIMTSERARAQGVCNLVYIHDQVLDQFEGKSEYRINPRNGSVSYDGWWALSYCRRIGRDYIAYEVKKIYEGCPPSIIRHIHRHAVPENIAVAQQRILGNVNIGDRAEKLINALGNLGLELADICDSLELPYEDADIIGLNKKDIDDNGWWTISSLKPLGYRVSQDITKEEFLERCKNIYKLFEGFKEKALRQLLIKLGMDSEKIKSIGGSFKLFATLMQLCSIALESGLDLVKHNKEIVSRWNPDIRLDELKPLFALADLRISAAHNSSEGKIKAALEVYGIDPDSMSSGWGIAVDQVYDRLAENLLKIVEMLQEGKGDLSE